MDRRARVPRFRRVTENLPPFRLTPRDLTILEAVAKHRFLRSTHIVGLIGHGRQQILRRLKLLYHHGYLERPRTQLDYYHCAGSKPMVYGLGRRGAGRLRRDLDMPFSRMDWTGRAQSIGRLFLDHSLLVSDFMVALELSCRASGNVRLLRHHDLSFPAAADAKDGPLKWKVLIPGRHSVGLVPDQTFALEFAGGDRAYFFLEADRGTMPVIRANLKQSSFLRKMLAYEATWSQDLHRSRFGFARFRVLTLTNSPERSQHLREACCNLERGRGLFLFLSAEMLTNMPDVLTLQWQGFHGPSSLM